MRGCCVIIVLTMRCGNMMTVPAENYLEIVANNRASSQRLEKSVRGQMVPVQNVIGEDLPVKIVGVMDLVVGRIESP